MPLILLPFSILGISIYTVQMNDLSTPRESTNSLDNVPAPEGVWSKTVAFLKRYPKSFFPAEKGVGGATEPKESWLEPVLVSVDTPVTSLVDFNKLPDLAFRREVLDWRDNFHAAVTLAVARLEDSFIQQMQADLDNVSLLRKVLARPSDEILQDSFVRIVRLPLIAVLRKEENKLNAIAQKWDHFAKVELVFDTCRLNAECASLHDIGFKFSKKNMILARIQTLMLGPAGIAEHFRDQGMHLSRKLLETKKS